MSLRFRITCMIAPLIILQIALGAAGVWLLRDLDRQSEDILRSNYDSIYYMNRMNGALRRMDSAFLHGLAGNWKTANAERDAAWNTVMEQLELEKNNITIHPEEDEFVADLVQRIERFRAESQAFFQSSADPSSAHAAYFGKDGTPGGSSLSRSVADLLTAVDRIALLNENRMRQTSLQVRETATRSVMQFVLGLAGSLLIAGLAGWGLWRTILDPIRLITNAAASIGRGELHQLLDASRRDELGSLAEAFNRMAQKLRAYRHTNLQRLLRAEAASRAAINSFPDPIVVIDPGGKVTSANTAAKSILGVNSATEPDFSQLPSHVIDQKSEDLQDSLLEWLPRESLRTALTLALTEEKSTLTDTFEDALIIRIRNEERAFLPQVRPILSAEGDKAVLGAALVLNDVTRFRLMDRFKSDWAATVSHELKTPLTSIRLAVHVLLEEVIGPLTSKQSELLIEARDCTERLWMLIEHLLALARLESGSTPLKTKPVPVMNLLQTAYDTCEPRARDHHVSVVLNDAPNLPLVAVDPIQIGQVLDNLLDNAVAHVNAGGIITITSSRHQTSEVLIRIHDTGIGIPPDALEHIFDRFYHIPGRTRSQGTGLGLAIASEILTAHGGSITCESPPGAGTTFTITLPIWNPHS